MADYPKKANTHFSKQEKTAFAYAWAGKKVAQRRHSLPTSYDNYVIIFR